MIKTKKIQGVLDDATCFDIRITTRSCLLHNVEHILYHVNVIGGTAVESVRLFG